MEPNTLPEWIESEFEFPLERSTVVQRAGDRVVDAPDPEASETLATILERSGDETYHSTDHLLDAIWGSVSEEYVGRKYYGDRGWNPPAAELGAPSHTAESF